MPAYHRTKSQIQQEYAEIVAAQKNPQRFGPVYERYYEQIFLFIIKRTGEEMLAADITSQVFLKAMLNLKKYQFKGLPFSSWLYRIAINEVNQYFRDNKGTRHISLESGGVTHLMEEVDEPVDQEHIAHLLRTLDQLKPEEVQLVELRYFERMRFKEIATILHITENNAKVRLSRILKRLKKRMEQPAG
ncbi:MAG: RNA polymerase sigma factor [Bacteroidia bacterium]